MRSPNAFAFADIDSDELCRRLRAQPLPCMDGNDITALAADEIERLRAALEFYADPWEHQAKRGLRPENADWEPVPDFYDEADFGSRARAALSGEKS